MDWPRIKTILITVLVVTNLLLGFMIFNEQSTFQGESEERLANIRELYAQKGIQIDEHQSFKFPKRIDALSVEYDTYGEPEVQKALGATYEYDGVLYSSSKGEVTLTGTTFEYYAASYQPEQNLFDLAINQLISENEAEKTIESTCDEFLDTLGFAKDYVFQHYLNEGGYTYVCVKQLYKDYFLNDSSMILVLKDNTVVGIKRQWLNIIDNNSQGKYDIISVDMALYKLMENFKQSDVIADISIGYKLNDSSLLVSDLISGEALPYYRITLQSGEEFYVQAVTEER